MKNDFLLYYLIYNLRKELEWMEVRTIRKVEKRKKIFRKKKKLMSKTFSA